MGQGFLWSIMPIKFYVHVKNGTFIYNNHENNAFRLWCLLWQHDFFCRKGWIIQHPDYGVRDKIHIKLQYIPRNMHTVFCFAVLCCGYTLTDFPISIRLTSLALWQSNDCPSASKATLMNMDKYFIWIHYERLHNHNKAKHNKTVCIFLGIYCMCCDYPPMAKFKRRLLFGMVELIHTRENMVCNTCSHAIIVDIIYTVHFTSEANLSSDQP